MDSEDSKKFNFKVSGMTCATCSRIVERGLSKVQGVSFASVNLSTETAFVIADDSVDYEALESAVKKCGYTAIKDVPDDYDETKYREARADLIFVMAIGLPMSLLMFLHMFFGVHFAWYGVLEFFAGAAAIFWGGRRTLRGAWIALVHGHTNMDTLIAISASAAWLTSLMHLLGANIPSFGTVGIMILMLHITGRYIESRLRDRAAKHVKTLLKLQPREARVMTDGKATMTPVAAVKPDTLIQVKVGERIPLDGVVESGVSGVDESLLTGESMPVIKDVGASVTGGAMNLYGALLIRTTKTGEDTFLSKMLDLVREAQGSKIPLQALADRLTLKFVPTVIALAAVSAAAWYLAFDRLVLYIEPLAVRLPWPTAFSTPAGAAAYSFVATLVIACPCALGLATPLALVVSAGEASRTGLLIRNAEAIQTLREVDCALLDKTGTLTKGEPSVTSWKLPDEAIPYVRAIESMSGHPVASAVVDILPKCDEPPAPDSMTETPGDSVAATWGDTEWAAGRPSGRARYADKDTGIVEIRKNGEPIGWFAVTDTLRDDSAQAVKDLKALGITPIMATGDRMGIAIKIAGEVGIDKVYWEVRPEDKLSIIHKLQGKGHRVLMAGDGINDAAALKGAHVGAAMGGGMDLAVDSADIVILNGGLSKIVKAVRISDKTWHVIRQNLFGAFIYNIIAIPLAMSGLLHPIAAELAMAASSVTVILNSMRISGSAEK